MCKMVLSSVLFVFLVGCVCSSFEPRAVPCTLLCLAGNSPVTEPSTSSDAADSVVPSLRALVYRVDQ